MAQMDVLDYIRHTPNNSNVNVVKGMLGNSDESNSDWSTAEIKFFGNAGFELVAPILTEGEEQEQIATGGTLAITYPNITPTATIILFQSKAIISIQTEATITVTGNIQDMGYNFYIITGDGTVTFS